MITNDQQLKATQGRIERLQDWLARMRQGARPEEWAALSSGYRLEIERMQAEVLDYLLAPTAVGRETQPA